jgi:hypothetical protein
LGIEPLFKGPNFFIFSSQDEFTQASGTEKHVFEQFIEKFASEFLLPKQYSSNSFSNQENFNFDKNLNFTIKSELLDLFSVLNSTQI